VDQLAADGRSRDAVILDREGAGIPAGEFSRLLANFVENGCGAAVRWSVINSAVPPPMGGAIGREILKSLRDEIILD
jgi:hypothetical protein